MMAEVTMEEWVEVSKQFDAAYVALGKAQLDFYALLIRVEEEGRKDAPEVIANILGYSDTDPPTLRFKCKNCHKFFWWPVECCRRHRGAACPYCDWRTGPIEGLHTDVDGGGA